jgi:hypothetical protein
MHLQIRFILPDDMYSKYQTFKRTAEVNNDPESKWCPNTGCDTAVKRKDPQNLLMQCPTCNMEFCFNCAKPVSYLHMMFSGTPSFSLLTGVIRAVPPREDVC